MSIFPVIFFALLAQLSSAEHWAVLVAGSNGYDNYRHQADVCHAYQVLHKHGFPDERIIVMMFDDLANNQRNPTPGVIVNQPGGPDVYKGVSKDYIESDVTPENFLKILRGENMTGIGSGKTLGSGAADHVFVYFADHGAPGLIAFPNWQELHARDLMDTIQFMHSKEKYGQMVIYVEACESGSMFNHDKLPSDINVFATTAANGQESSYACYWDNTRQTYLADVYSAMWLQDSDKADMGMETLWQQFEKVKEQTSGSHVRFFGDESIATEPIAQFQGKGAMNGNTTKNVPTISPHDMVPSPDVSMMILYNRLKAATTDDERRSIQYEMQVESETRAAIKRLMKNIVQEIYTESHPRTLLLLQQAPVAIQHECYKSAVTAFRETCFAKDISKYEYALRHIYVLANLCNEGLNTELILRSINKMCSQ